MRIEFLFSWLLVCMPGLVRAAENDGLWDNPYLTISAGGNWSDDLRSPSGSYSFEPGYRLGVAPGLRLAPYAAVEAEFGFMWNTVNERTTGAGRVDAEGEFWRVPFLINVIGQYPIQDFTPYIGIGGGAIYQDFTATGAGFDISDTRSDSAFQAFVGFNYRLSENIYVGASYKYLRTVIREQWYIIGPIPEKPKPHGNHSIAAAVQFVF